MLASVSFLQVLIDAGNVFDELFCGLKKGSVLAGFELGSVWGPGGLKLGEGSPSLSESNLICAPTTTLTHLHTLPFQPPSLQSPKSLPIQLWYYAGALAIVFTGVYDRVWLSVAEIHSGRGQKQSVLFEAV